MNPDRQVKSEPVLNPDESGLRDSAPRHHSTHKKLVTMWRAFYLLVAGHISIGVRREQRRVVLSKSPLRYATRRRAQKPRPHPGAFYLPCARTDENSLAARPRGEMKSIPPAASHMVPELELHGMGVQVHLFAEILLVILAHVVVQQGNGDDEGCQPEAMVVDDLDHLLFFV